MAEVKLVRILAAAAVLLVAAAYLCAQNAAAPGSLAGKLTDLHSKPLADTALLVRNQETGAETRTSTTKNGSYRVDGLEPGTYTLEAESAELGRGQLTGILVQSGHEAHVQAAMTFAPLPPHKLVLAFHEIPTETFAPLVEFSLHPARNLHAASVWMPAFVLDPPPTQIPLLLPNVSAALSLPLQLQNLPLQDVDRPVTLLPAQAATARTPEAQSPETPLLASVHTAPAAIALPSLPALPPATAAAPAPPVSKPSSQNAQPAANRQPAAEPAPTTEPSLLTSTLTGSEMQSLPVSGRRWEEFTLDTPAATAATGQQAGMSGLGEGEADTVVDGVSTRLAFGDTASRGRGSSGKTEGEPEGMGSAWANGRGFMVSEAAVRQVQTTTGVASSDAGRAAAGRVSVSTLRGSNGLHGQGFYFDRQNTWGAQNPFTTWVKETAPATSSAIPTFAAQPYTPPDHETIWGIGIGRQIRRDRLFWFAALDGMHRNDPGVSAVKHPDQFFAQPTNDRMQLLGAQLGSGSLAIPKYSSMLETLDSLLGPAARTTAQWVGFVRVDWNMGERHRITLEGTAANWNSPGGGFTRVSEAYGNHSFGSSQASKLWGLGRWEAFLTPNLLSVTQASIGRTVLGTHAGTPSAYENTLNINVWGQLPQIVVDSRYGFSIGNPSRFGPGSYPDERIFHAQQSLDWVHGKLMVHAGFQLDHNVDWTSSVRNHTGTYHYANVENFATDALVFAAFGMSDALDKMHQHNCDQTGKVWRDSAGGLRGLGYLPCYSYYTQTMGPTAWHVGTNDLAGYATAQWQPAKFAVFSAGLRWEIEQLPPPIPSVDNPALPQTEKALAPGSNWEPRISLAVGAEDSRWPVFRLGYGIYSSRIQNSTLQTVLSNTGSLNGDLSFFLRPTDNLNAGGAPPFPYVFAGEPINVVKPAATAFAPGFRNPQVHQALASLEQSLPGHLQVSAGTMLSLGRRLPVTIDTNINPTTNPGTITYAVVDASGKGPIKASQITVPFYATWPTATGTAGRANAGYQQIVEIQNRANSTYEAAIARITRYGSRGLTLHAHYTYAHAMDWNPNEGLRLTGGSVLDPEDFGLEYGTSNLDVRHSASALVLFRPRWKLRGAAGKIANGWSISGVGSFRSGLPYTMRTSGSLPKRFAVATGAAIVGLGPGINGAGGDNRIYGTGNDGQIYNLGRNTYRYPANWKADMRLGKRFDLGHLRELELMAESFNLLNHRNITAIETTGYTIQSGTISGGLPSLNFMTGLKTNSTAFGQPLNTGSTNFYRERQIELGVRLRF
ncbi:MAG: carboxypeptidase-like regulatory domain-containing protein [Terracidiphilus sp.]|nr:carboxypeptidase-like regulatory domain-containing protein [Terracidiphilus sp.]